MGLPALAADYLFVGPLMLARLLEQVPELPAELVESPEQVLRADQRPAVAKLMWAGDRFDTTESGRAGGGASQLVHQRWLLVLGLNNPAVDPAGRNTAAGPLLSRLHRAMSGWSPAGANRPVRRAQAALAPTFTTTQAIYPLGFEITLTL